MPPKATLSEVLREVAKSREGLDPLERWELDRAHILLFQRARRDFPKAIGFDISLLDLPSVPGAPPHANAIAADLLKARPRHVPTPIWVWWREVETFLLPILIQQAAAASSRATQEGAASLMSLIAETQGLMKAKLWLEALHYLAMLADRIRDRRVFRQGRQKGAESTLTRVIRAYLASAPQVSTRQVIAHLKELHWQDSSRPRGTRTPTRRRRPGHTSVRECARSSPS